MLDGNLFTLEFRKAEGLKMVLVDTATGEPVYDRLRTNLGIESDQRSTIELYHSSTFAPLGSLHSLTHKLKLISLVNPSRSIELKNSGYITWEWTFEPQPGLRLVWRKDIVGLSSNKRGFTCSMVRKPDPDYPCAIYRPGSTSSGTPPSCQFLDFNIRRIENLEDGKGLEIAIILSLLSFTESLVESDSRPTSTIGSTTSMTTIQKPNPTPKPPTMDYSTTSPKRTVSGHTILMYSHMIASLLTLVMIIKLTVEPNELRLSSDPARDKELIDRGARLLEDPLFLYLYIHALDPNHFSRAVIVADQIKRSRFKKHEELHQYLIDDIILDKSKNQSKSNKSTNKQSQYLKIYLSRTPLDELLPSKSVVKPASSTNSLNNRFTNKITSHREIKKPKVPPKSEDSDRKKIWNNKNRPLVKRISIELRRTGSIKDFLKNRKMKEIEEDDHEKPKSWAGKKMKRDERMKIGTGTDEVESIIENQMTIEIDGNNECPNYDEVIELEKRNRAGNRLNLEIDPIDDDRNETAHCQDENWLLRNSERIDEVNGLGEEIEILEGNEELKLDNRNTNCRTKCLEGDLKKEAKIEKIRPGLKEEGENFEDVDLKLETQILKIFKKHEDQINLNILNQELNESFELINLSEENLNEFDHELKFSEKENFKEDKNRDKENEGSEKEESDEGFKKKSLKNKECKKNKKKKKKTKENKK